MEGEHRVIFWETTKNGELYLDLTVNVWTYRGGSREITITPWNDTKKGPITEICIQEGGEEFVIEILEKEFDKELFSPEDPNEAAEEVMGFIVILSRMEMNDTEKLRNCVKKFTKKLTRIRAVHVYCANNVSFGMKKKWFGKIKLIHHIPDRAIEFLGTKLR